MTENMISWSNSYYHSDLNVREYDRMQISFIYSMMESKIKDEYVISEKEDV